MENSRWKDLEEMQKAGETVGNLGFKFQQMKLEKEKAAREAIKAKFEQHQALYKDAWEKMKDPDVPGQYKVHIWNHIIVPFDKTMMGVDTPPMTKWSSDLQKTMTQAANIISNPDYSVKDKKFMMMHLRAEVADNPKTAEAFKPIDQTLAEMSGKDPIDVTVGDKTVKASKNMGGTYDPVTVNGVGNGVAPSQLSQQTAKDRADSFNAAIGKFQEASKIVASSKDGGLEALFPGLSPAQREQAVREAHASMYIVGGQIGLDAHKISGVIDGSLESNKVLSDVGKNFALPGAHVDTSGDAPIAKPLPGLSVTPKQVSEVPPVSTPDAPQMASAPAPVAPVSDVPQMSAANAPDPTMPKDIANA